MKKQVLFIGAGRRVSLAELFIQQDFEVTSYETTNMVPISSVAEVIIGKKFKDPEIINDLLGVIQKLKNKNPYQNPLVIPLMDEAIEIVSSLQSVSGMHQLPVSGWEASGICYDKKKFEEWMVSNFPNIYPKNDNSFKFIIKPRFGFGSHGIETGKPGEQKLIEEKVESISVIQKFIKGTEYSVDAYFNKENKYIDGIVRERLRVFDGEVISSAVVYEPRLTDLVKEVGEKLQLQGPTCFQFIMEDFTHDIYLIEINARFGGGYTLTHAAGLDMISMLDKEYVQQLNYDWNYLVPADGVIKKKFLRMERSFRDTFFEI